MNQTPYRIGYQMPLRNVLANNLMPRSKESTETPVSVKTGPALIYH